MMEQMKDGMKAKVTCPKCSSSNIQMTVTNSDLDSWQLANQKLFHKALWEDKDPVEAHKYVERLRHCSFLYLFFKCMEEGCDGAAMASIETEEMDDGKHECVVTVLK